MLHCVQQNGMGGCFASPSAVLVGWFGMAQGKVPPHKKRQQQNAAAIERCYPIHPCHHLFASVFLAYVVWERQHGLAALPLAECAMLGKTCLRMRFRKQSLLSDSEESSCRFYSLEDPSMPDAVILNEA